MIILTRTISQILTAGLALFMLMSCGRNEPGPSLLILTEAPGALGTPDYLRGYPGDTCPEQGSASLYQENRVH